jgi:type IV pilus biogenesis protein CpaD/CtpE
MSGQVSFMVHFESKTRVQTKRILVVLGLAVTLAGCALDDFAKEEAFEPYGGSKQHPIIVANGKATVEKCGDWSENLTDTSENTMAPNHGCAVQSNIAALAAYPNDLVHARRMTRPPAFSRVVAIKGLGGVASASSSESTATPKP